MRVPVEIRDAMVTMALSVHPEEACGLLAADGGGELKMVYQLTNILHTHTNYTIDPTEHFRAMRHAERNGWELVGVFHSHPHTGAFPSPTDVRLAPDPDWLYLLVGFEDFDDPAVRGFHIREGSITEVALEFEPISVTPR